MTQEKSLHNPHEYPYEDLINHEVITDAPEAPVVRTSIVAFRKNGEYVKAAGNLSPLFQQPDMQDLLLDADLNNLPAEEVEQKRHEREQIALGRLFEYLHAEGVEPSDTFIVKPQNQWRKGIPLHPANADELPDDQREFWNMEADDGSSIPGPERPKEQSDMIYTRNPNQALAILPADCPTLIGRGQDAEGNWVMWLQHGGWNGLNEGYLDDGLDFARDELGVDLSKALFHIAPGGIEFKYHQDIDPHSPENDKFTHPRLLENLENFTEAEGGGYDFEINMFGFIMDALADRGVDVEHQVYVNNTDTSRLDSGHSSHQRFADKSLGEDRQPFASRDMVLVMSPELSRAANQRAVDAANRSKNDYTLAA
jgi:copper oxidase (laccase) domain-containing protein